MSGKILSMYEYEVQQLILWHRDQEYKASSIADYDVAKEHKDRADKLTRIVFTVEESEAV